MQDERDLYEVLGLARGAIPDEIKKAYRAAVKHAHPDRGGSDAAFTAVQRAYEVLNDPGRRAAYDEFGPMSLQPMFDQFAERARRAEAWRAQQQWWQTQQPSLSRVIHRDVNVGAGVGLVSGGTLGAVVGGPIGFVFGAILGAALTSDEIQERPIIPR